MFGLNATIKKSALPYLAAVFFVAIDRYLKVLVADPEVKPIKLLPHFNFTYHLNNNASFSLPVNQTLLIFLSALIICGFAFAYYRSLRNHRPEWLFVWIIMGALSNLADRFLYGGVIDYLDLDKFTVFNLADVLISVAVLILIIQNLKNNRPPAIRLQNQL